MSDLQRFAHAVNIMHPEKTGAQRVGRYASRGGGIIPLGYIGTDDLAQETLARRSDHHGKAQRRKHRQPAQHSVIVFGPFGKPQPGIEDDAVAAHTMFLCHAHRVLKFGGNFGGYIVIFGVLIRGYLTQVAPGVHEYEARPVLGTHGGYAGVQPQPRHIVQGPSANIEGPAAGLWIDGINAHRHRGETTYRLPEHGL